MHEVPYQLVLVLRFRRTDGTYRPTFNDKVADPISISLVEEKGQITAGDSADSGSVQTGMYIYGPRTSYDR